MMSGKITWMTLLLLVLGILALGGEPCAPRMAARAAGRERAPNPLPDWPADAPIQTQPRPRPAKLDQRAAEQRVRRYLGIDRTIDVRMAAASLTDNDFPFLKPKGQAIWLAEVRNLRIPAPRDRDGATPNPKAIVIARLYVAIDGDNGQLVEAFTPSTQPWWRKKAMVLGAAHENYLRDTGQLLERPTDAPGITLLDVLREFSDAQGQGQLEIRYALYSNQKAGRREKAGFVPVALRRPALLIFREGIEMKARSGKVLGRQMVVVDAQTGEPLYNQSSGNPIP